MERERKDVLVSHPSHGETIVRGVQNNYEAIVEAARRWKAQWSEVAKFSTFVKLEEELK